MLTASVTLQISPLIDMSVLLPHQEYWNFDEAFDFVQDKIISQI